MKAGANRKDVIAIKRLTEQGETAEFISSGLQIDLSVVKGFMSSKPKADGTPKETPKTKTKSGKSKLADSFAA